MTAPAPSPSLPDEQLYGKSRDLKRLFGLSGRTITRYVAEREDFPWVRLPTRTLMFPIDKVREWLESHGKAPIAVWVPDPEDRTRKRGESKTTRARRTARRASKKARASAPARRSSRASKREAASR